jgi:hypothetical protein
MAGMRPSEGAENPEVYLAFSPSFERIWLETKKRLPRVCFQKPANSGPRSQYSICQYGWAKKHVLERSAFSWNSSEKVLGLESVQDAGGKII